MMRRRLQSERRLTLRSIVVAAAHMLLLLMSHHPMEAQAQTRVYSIKPVPGDFYTHSGASYRFYLFWHQPGWYYGHLQYNGIVGINTLYPRAGNGSCYLRRQIVWANRISSSDTTWWRRKGIGDA
jgi:hypothetical protein